MQTISSAALMIALITSLPVLAGEVAFDAGGMTQMRVMPVEARKQLQQVEDVSIAVWPTGLIDADRTHYLVEGDATILMVAIANPKAVSIHKGWLVCELPPGVALSGSNAQIITESIESATVNREGVAYTRHRAAIRPARFTYGDGKFTGFTAYQAASLWLSTTLAPGARPGRIVLHLEYQTEEGGATARSEASTVEVAVLPPLKGVTPTIARSGLMGRASVSIDKGDAATSSAITSLLAHMGCNYYYDGPPQSTAPAGLKRWTEGHNIWQENSGFRHIDGRIGVGNGYLLHTPGALHKQIPETIQFKLMDGNRRERVIAPWALYTKHPWVREQVLGVIREDIMAGRYESLWANWEPEAGAHYLTNGDYSDGSREQFIAWSKLPAEQVIAAWPQEVAAKFPEQWRAFRNWELGQWTRVLAETVQEASRSVGGNGRFIPCTVSDYMFSNQADHHAIDSAAWGDFPYTWQTWTYYDVPLVDQRFPMSDRSGASMVVRSGVVARQLDRLFGERRQMTGGCVYGWDQGGWDLGGRNGFYVPEQLGFLHLSTVMAGLEVTGNYGEWPVFDGRYAHALAAANRRIARWEEFTLKGHKQREHVVIPTSPYPQVVAPHVKPQEQEVTPWENPNYLFSYEYALGKRRLFAVANTWDLGECFFRLRVFGLDEDKRYRLTEPEAERIFADEAGQTTLTADQLEQGLVLHVGAMRWGAFVVEPIEGASSGQASAVKPVEVNAAQRGRTEALLAVYESADRTWGRERRGRERQRMIAGLARDCADRVAVASFTSATPRIDGLGDDSCWSTTAVYGDFRTTGARETSAYITTWRAAHQNGQLYLLIDCRQDMRAPVIVATQRDGKVWRDDSVEVLINGVRPRSGVDYTQAVINAGGALFDTAAGRADWNGVGQWAVRTDEQGWTAELAIPLTGETVAPVSSSVYRLNVIRNVQRSATNAAESSSWFPVWGPNSDVLARGLLVLQ